MKSKIFRADNTVMKNVNRQLKMKQPTENYMTKMDLIDTHPELFDRRGKNLNFSKQEIQLLRNMTNFHSVNPQPLQRHNTMKNLAKKMVNYKDEKIVNLELPEIIQSDPRVLHPIARASMSLDEINEWYERPS